jgi:hypothetical protein
MEILKMNYTATPISKGGYSSDINWGVSVSIGDREAALLCRKGKPVLFKTCEDANDYIKEELN